MDRRDRDPLAIMIAAISIVVQVVIWVWWGGRLAERVDGFERRMETTEISEQTKTGADARQDTAIAVLDSKLDYIKNSVDAISRKLK